MNAGKGWRNWKITPDSQVKTEDCPLMCAQCRSSGQCCIDNYRAARAGPCLKTCRILQIQSCWQGSKMVFPIVNWRELDSRLLFLEKSIPLPCLSFLLSVFFEDKCSQASAEGFCPAAFPSDTHCHFLRAFWKVKTNTLCKCTQDVKEATNLMLGPCQVFAVSFIPVTKIILRNFKHFLQLTKLSLLEDVSVLTLHLTSPF